MCAVFLGNFKKSKFHEKTVSTQNILNFPTLSLHLENRVIKHVFVAEDLTLLFLCCHEIRLSGFTVCSDIILTCCAYSVRIPTGFATFYRSLFVLHFFLNIFTQCDQISKYAGTPCRQVFCSQLSNRHMLQTNDFIQWISKLLKCKIARFLFRELVSCCNEYFFTWFPKTFTIWNLRGESGHFNDTIA